MIRVLIVDDSAVAREFLSHLIDSQPDMEVVGTAKNGAEAVLAVNTLQPTIVVMDSNMPVLDGYQATRKIMEEQPRPVVIASASFSPQEVSTTFKAVEAGALAVLAKPVGLGHPDHPEAVASFLQTIRLMSEVKVIRRRNPKKATSDPTLPAPGELPATKVDVVAIGASTGGPQVIQTILSCLRQPLATPVLIVQHISPGFVQGFVEWLGKTTGLPVQVAAAQEKILPNHVYVAPDGHHLGVDHRGHVILAASPPENGLRPAVSFLFRSVLKAYGRRAAAVLLSGMGRDGAAELKLLREAGAITIAQDEASAVIFGMPGEAVKLGAAMHVAPPEEIARIINALAGS